MSPRLVLVLQHLGVTERDCSGDYPGNLAKASCCLDTTRASDGRPIRLFTPAQRGGMPSPRLSGSGARDIAGSAVEAPITRLVEAAWASSYDGCPRGKLDRARLAARRQHRPTERSDSDSSDDSEEGDSGRNVPHMHRCCIVCGYVFFWLIFCFSEFSLVRHGSHALGVCFCSALGFPPHTRRLMSYPSVPLIKEETYAKTGEPSAKRPLLRQGADTPLGNRTERVGPRAE